MGLRKRQLLARSRAKNQWSQFCCDDGDKHGDGEDVDGNEEVWTELSATNTDLSNFIEDVPESWIEKVEIDVSNEETRWRSPGWNTNIRGAGSSRATHFRNKRQIAQLLQAQLSVNQSVNSLTALRLTSTKSHLSKMKSHLSMRTAVRKMKRSLFIAVDVISSIQ